MIETTGQVIIMSRTELNAIIDQAAIRAVQEALKHFSSHINTARPASVTQRPPLFSNMLRGSRMNPIIRKSVEVLSRVVNTPNGLAHPLDESRAKELFKALHKQGLKLQADDVYQAAMANDWSAHHATQLSELASKIGNGGRVQIKHKRDWGEPTVRRIISELQEG